ncbi:hypothetical protein Tco_0584275 [Tanacetum coccineum]
MEGRLSFTEELLELTFNWNVEVAQKKQKPRKPKREDTKLPQPSGSITNVADEVVYEERDKSLERVVTTTTSLDAEQDRGNINEDQSKATLYLNTKGGQMNGLDKDADITLVKCKTRELLLLVDVVNTMYLTFGKMLKNFNREDLEALWSIVKARFKKTGRIVGIKSLLEVTAAQVRVTVAKQNLVMFSNLNEKYAK